AERNHIGHDLLVSRLDVARLSALRAGFERGTLDFTPPQDAPAQQVARVRSAMVARAGAQDAKLSAIDQQIAQKDAEAAEVAATIAKLEASLPLVSEEADVRRKAMQLEYGNRIAHLEAQTKLVEQQHELIVQQQKAKAIPAARKALERQREQA